MSQRAFKNTGADAGGWCKTSHCFTLFWKEKFIILIFQSYDDLRSAVTCDIALSVAYLQALSLHISTQKVKN